MNSKSLSDDKPVGVIGAGNFGTVVANMLALHSKVLLYARDERVVNKIIHQKENRGHVIHHNVTPTNDLAHLAEKCDIIFPMVPSEHFRAMMKKLSPHLHPYHILIHGTKGFDITLPETAISIPLLITEPVLRELKINPPDWARRGCAI